MYKYIGDFLVKEKGCDPATISIEQTTFRKGKLWTMDVVGIRASRIYGVEAKVGCGYYDIIDAITKARFYKYACSYVYVCFSRADFERSQLKGFLEEECKQHGVGLLLLNSDGLIEEFIEPQESDIIDLDIYVRILNQLRMFQPRLSTEVQGARAYIIRDICSFIGEKGYFREDEFIKYVGQSERYWRAQRPGARGVTLQDLIRNRIHWSLKAAEELGLIEKSGKNRYTLTLLGKILMYISVDQAKKPTLSEGVKIFFFTLAWHYPEVKEALAFLRRRGKAPWTHSKCSKCGNSGWKARLGYPENGKKAEGAFFIADGRIVCGKCKKVLREGEDSVSVYHYIMKIFNRSFYEQLTFWFNSEVLPVKFEGPGGRDVRYDEGQLITPTLERFCLGQRAR